MSLDVFAHHCYGLLLNPTQELTDFEEKFLNYDAYDDYAFNQDDDSLPADEEEYERIRAEELQRITKILIQRHELPSYPNHSNCGLHYTGSDDDRPGRCQTDSEWWILGYGVLAFPLGNGVDVLILRKLKERGAQWYSWVTAS